MIESVTSIESYTNYAAFGNDLELVQDKEVPTDDNGNYVPDLPRYDHPSFLGQKTI